MSDTISVGNIHDSIAVAIGDGATAIAHIINNILPPDQRPQTALHLPPLATAFTGRLDYVQDIASGFVADNGYSVVVTQAINGMGGVGKTQVALAYAHLYRPAYDIIWQLAADDVAALDGSLRQLGVTLELPLLGLDAATMRAKVLSRLSESGARVLLIYDNADTIEPRELRPYLPTGCHTLITSRRSDGQWGGMAKPLALGVFTEAEGMAFWMRRLGGAPERGLAAPSPYNGDPDGGGLAAPSPEVGLLSGGRLPDGEKARLLDDEKARLLELGELLGWLPLAMEQAAAFMLKRKKNVAAYVVQFTERREGLWKRETAPDDYHATVATTWAMAFDHAQETTGAAELLNLCCFFAPDEIPLAVILDGAEKLPAPLAAVMADEDEREDALEALGAYSLLTVADGKKAAMHRLVQDVARRGMGAGEQGSGGEGVVWVEAAMGVLSKAYHFDQHDMETWAACGQLLPHVKAAVGLAVGLGVESTEASYLNAVSGAYLNQYGDYAGAILFSERTLAIEEAQPDPDYPRIATSLNNMGALLQAMGEYEEARPFYTRALTIKEKILGSDHPGTALSLNNLGGLLQSMGEYEEALPFYTRALAIREKQLGSNHPNVAQSLNNMGALLQAMGEYEEAWPFYTRALAIDEKALGLDHPDTARDLNNMGALLRVMEEYEEARPFYTRALVIFEKQLGPDHPNVATANNNLGALLQAIGEYEEARLFYTRALAIREKQLGINHPDVAKSLNNMGLLLKIMGEYEEARLFYTRALAIREKQLDPNHPDVAKSLNNMGSLLQSMGEYEEARPFYTRALAIRGKQLGSNHPDVAQSYNNLATLSYYEGDMQTAARLMRQALAIYEKALGDNHPNTQSARRSLSVIEAAASA